MAAKIWTVCALRLDFVRMLRVEYVRVSVCVGGGIRWVSAGRKWRTLRFGYEQLESIERGCRREEEEEKKKEAG